MAIGGLNPEAPEYIPLSHCVFFFDPIYPITPYDPSYYQLNSVHHFPTTPPPPPPPPATAQSCPIITHQKPQNQEFVERNQGLRFGACRENRRYEGRKENNKFGKEKVGNGNYGRSDRVVQSCVMQMRRPKPVLPLIYCEANTTSNNVEVITTVMIRNIPNKLTRGGLVELLDHHCMLMNQTSKESGDQNVSAYDFLYLPIDFKTGVNKGYAFVNFTTNKAVWNFHTAFHNKKWDDYITPKITEIVRAKIQVWKKELVKHFGSTMFICESDEYLPLCFIPARDGSGKTVLEVIVGKRGREKSY